MLEEAGFECELLEAEPGRPNLVADLRSGEEGPTLCFLSHVDTVTANPEDWTFDPWSGDVRDGFVLGRGAQDMKDQVATEVAAAVWLANSGWRPKRGGLKVVVTADEECGAHLGAKWLCENHPEKMRCDMVVNEGAGALFELDGKRFFTVSVGEKGVFRFKLRAHGTAGHGSVPSLGDNALMRLAPLLSRFEQQPALEPTPAGKAFLSGVLGREVGRRRPGRGAGRAAGAKRDARRLRRRADAAGDVGSDEDQRLRSKQRDPGDGRSRDRHSRAAGPRRGRRPGQDRADPRRARRPGRDRVHGDDLRQRVAARYRLPRPHPRLAGRGRARGDAGPRRDGRLLRQPLVAQGLRR